MGEPKPLTCCADCQYYYKDECYLKHHPVIVDRQNCCKNGKKKEGRK